MSARASRRLRGALAVACAVSACRSENAERRWVTCTCDYVTDFDQPGHIGIEVCSSEADPRAAAESCARGAGVGAVTACRCGAMGADRCDKSTLCRNAVAP